MVDFLLYLFWHVDYHNFIVLIPWIWNYIELWAAITRCWTDTPRKKKLCSTRTGEIEGRWQNIKTWGSITPNPKWKNFVCYGSLWYQSQLIQHIRGIWIHATEVLPPHLEGKCNYWILYLIAGIANSAANPNKNDQSPS